jgi:hypothetical protein
MSVIVTIDKSAVFEEVNKHTSYAGAKAGASLYDKVRLKTDDETMLERWWCDACGLITTLSVPYAVIVSPLTPDTTSDFTLTLNLPSNWNTVQGVILTATANEIVRDYLLQQWFLLLGLDDKAKAAAERQATASSKYAVALYDRERPARPTYTNTVPPSESTTTEDEEE